jgi:hypothetical protein
MIIPVRVPAALMPVLANERRFAAGRGHPLDAHPCPVCDKPIGEGVSVLVFAGIDPEDRKPGGWTTGEAVAVHALCAGVPEQEPGDTATEASEADGLREQLAVTRERLESLAAQLEESAAVTAPSKKSQIEMECAAAVRSVASGIEVTS